MDIINHIKNPSAEYRPIPFWSFNDKLEPDVLRTQIREMKKAGIGGYFMHARGGLKTEYMSDDWLDCIEACIDEGNKQGMNSWCYDENGWPSGFADGVVPAMGESYHVKWLALEEVSTFDIQKMLGEKSTLGIYSYDEVQKQIKRILSENQLDSALKYFLVKYSSNPCYVDILNKDTIAAFIKVTHERYYKQFVNQFGEGIKGFFTDEPQFSRDQIPWSHILPQEFMKNFGYDITDSLAALFIECNGYEKIRYDFWSTVSSLYVNSFGKQIFDWCEAHNCQLTGHVMLEDNLWTQMRATAGAMPFYEYMHIPGMDWLCRAIDSPIIPKQVSSVASQLGKKQVISETFALCGWDVSFEELKWIAEWQYVNGVNLMCQHLEGYSLKGLRKRDYPPSLFYQQTWWNEYHHFNDYFSRLGKLLATGEAVAKVLLLHPIKSAWIAYNYLNTPKLQQLDEDFKNTTELLSALHIDHHYGDETIIAKHGSVEGDLFVVGKCKYEAVVLPSMITIDIKTIDLLESFINAGGAVISSGMFPEFVEGQRSNKLNELSKKIHHITSRDDIYKFLSKKNIPSISISGKLDKTAEIHYCERKLEDKRIFFVVNHSKEKMAADITIYGKGHARILSLEAVEYADIKQRPGENEISFKLPFEPMQSYLLVVENDNTTPETIETDTQQASQLLSLSTKWTIEKMGLNALTLDYCYYSIDNGPWEGPIHTINLMDLLLKRRTQCDIALKFDFNMELNLDKLHQLFLAIEDANEFEIYINNQEIKYQDIGWWKDSSFKKVNIRDFVLPGQNVIILKRSFYQSQKVYDVLFGENVLETERNKLTYDIELESIYLIGDFGIVSELEYSYGERKALFTNGPFTVVEKPTELVSGCFTEQGLCFFSDVMTISQTVNVLAGGTKYLLDLGRPNAAMCKVYINDKLAKTVLWAPYQIDVSNYLKIGENKISIELFASNRNLLGPHHNIVGESYTVGPATFTSSPGWSDSGELKSVWSDNYCFVKFGL